MADDNDMLGSGLRGFLSSAASGSLGQASHDDVYRLLEMAGRDPGRVAVSLGLVSAEEAPFVDSESVVRPLMSAYHDALAKDDHGSREIGLADAEHRGAAMAESVARMCHVSPAEYSRAALGVLEGDSVAFDRMMSDYYK